MKQIVCVEQVFKSAECQSIVHDFCRAFEPWIDHSTNDVNLFNSEVNNF